MAHLLVAGLSSRTVGFLNFHRSWKIHICKQNVLSFGRNQRLTIREHPCPVITVRGRPQRFPLKCGTTDPSEETVLLSSKECPDGSILFMFGSPAQRVQEELIDIPTEDGAVTNVEDKKEEPLKTTEENSKDAATESHFSKSVEPEESNAPANNIGKVETNTNSDPKNKDTKHSSSAKQKPIKPSVESHSVKKPIKHTSVVESQSAKSSTGAESKPPKIPVVAAESETSRTTAVAAKSKTPKTSSLAEESETPKPSVAAQSETPKPARETETPKTSPKRETAKTSPVVAESNQAQPSIQETVETKKSFESESEESKESAVKNADKRLKLRSGAAMRPHPSKVATGGEDAYFIEGTSWAGVADGVGGWALSGVDSGLYSRELMKNCWLLAKSETGIPNPKSVIIKGVEKTRAIGTCTAVLAALHDDILYIANVGDSGFLLIRKGFVSAKSKPMQRGFNFPYQIGTDGDDPSISETFHVPVAAGDILVLATDGVYDNLYEREIVDIVEAGHNKGVDPATVAMWLVKLSHEAGHHGNGRSPFSDAAKAAGYSYEGGKLDDATVVVSYVE